MTTPKPKDALEECVKDLQTIRDGLSDDTIALAKAAIPVAELQQEAVELLKEHKHFCLPSPQNVGIPNDTGNGIEWRIKVHTLLTQLEALKK